VQEADDEEHAKEEGEVMDAMSVATEFSRAVEARNWTEARRLYNLALRLSGSENSYDMYKPGSWRSLVTFMTNTLSSFNITLYSDQSGWSSENVLSRLAALQQRWRTEANTWTMNLEVQRGLYSLLEEATSEETWGAVRAFIDHVNEYVRGRGEYEGEGGIPSPQPRQAGGGGQRNGQLRLAMSAPLADRARSAVGMRTTLDELIGHLEDGQRIQAGCGCGERVKAQVAPAIGAGAAATVFGLPAVILAAMAILGAKYGPEIAQKLQQFFQGQPTTFAPDENAKISEAIAQANAQTVADFRAGNQSDYGLSFNPAAESGDFGMSFAQAEGWDNMSAETMTLWQEATSANPGNPCNYLGQQLRLIHDRLLQASANRPFGAPMPLTSTELTGLLERKGAITETIRRKCGGQWSWDWGDGGIDYGGKIVGNDFTHGTDDVFRVPDDIVVNP
jgi:hypothetical protein